MVATAKGYWHKQAKNKKPRGVRGHQCELPEVEFGKDGVAEGDIWCCFHCGRTWKVQSRGWTGRLYFRPRSKLLFGRTSHTGPL